MLKQASGGGGRDVLFTLRLGSDPKNKEVLDKFVKDATAAQSRLTESATGQAKRRADSEEKELARVEKQREKAAREALRNLDRIQREEERAAQKRQRELERQDRENDRYWANEAKRIDQRIREEERAAQARAKANEEYWANQARLIDENLKTQETATAKAEAANKEVTDSLLQASEGAIRFGKGLAQLGLAGEEDIQKLANALVKIEAAFNLAKGGVEIYRGITKAVAAYRSAVIAATTAETALAAARARSGAAGLGGAAAAGALGRGAAGAAAGGAAGTLGGGLASIGAVLATPAAALTAAAGSLLAAGAMLTNAGGSRDAAARAIQESGWTDPDRFFGFLSGGLRGSALAAGERTTRIEEAIAERRGRGAIRAQTLRAGGAVAGASFESAIERATGGGDVDTIAEASRRLMDLRRIRRETNAEVINAEREILMVQGKGAEERAAAEANRAEAYDRAIRAEKEIETVRKRANEIALEGLKKQTDELKKQRDAAKSEREKREGALFSAAQKFAEMSPFEQSAAIRATRKGRAGQELSAFERKQLGALGLSETESLSREANLAAANRSGFGAIAQPEIAAIEQARLTQRQAETQIAINNQLQVKLEGDAEKIANDTAEEVRALLEQRDRLLNERLREQLAEFRQEQDRRFAEFRAAQRGALRR